MPNDRLEELWKDPKHWSPIGIYRCADDPRWIVPKPIPALGYTLNFAQRGAIPLLLGMMVWVTAPTFMLLGLCQEVNLYAIVAAIAFPTVLLLLYCRRESNRRD